MVTDPEKQPWLLSIASFFPLLSIYERKPIAHMPPKSQAHIWRPLGLVSDDQDEAGAALFPGSPFSRALPLALALGSGSAGGVSHEFGRALWVPLSRRDPAEMH